MRKYLRVKILGVKQLAAKNVPIERAKLKK